MALVAANFLLPGHQRVEVGDSVDAEHHRFAVDHEVLLPVFQ
jgi:hypothetical protein